MTPPPPIVLRGVAFHHDGRPAVRGLSGVFAPGSLTAIVGPNGAGKTTLLRGLARLHRPAAGEIDFGGLPRRRVALTPQASTLDRTFPVTCLEAVTLAAVARLGWWRGATAADDRSALAALDEVGLDGMRGRLVEELSAGQFQRVLFARAIVQDAPVMLLDEPFAAVDETTQADLLGVMLGWHARGRTVIAVLHDLDLVRRHFPRALLLATEPVAWDATPSALSAANLRRAGFRAPGPVPEQRSAA